MSEDTSFSNAEIPLIPGALYGVRGFNINDDGTLRPLHRAVDSTFKQGVNTAGCHLGGKWFLSWGKSTGLHFTVDDSGLHLHPDEPSPQLSCTCGFYAYFDTLKEDEGSFLDGASNEHVNGIVRATGRCIVGNLGFRAEKLEIVGLVCDEPRDSTLKMRIASAATAVAHSIHKIPMKIMWGLMLFQVILGIVSLTVDNKILENVFWILTFAYWVFAAVHITSSTFLLWKLNHSDINPLTISTTKKIREQYPDIEFFSTLDEAKQKYPLSKASDIPS